MAISITERFEEAKAVLAGVKPSKSYTQEQQQALGFLTKLLVALAGHQAKGQEVFAILLPHRPYILSQLMLITITPEIDESDPIAQTVSMLTLYDSLQDKP